MSVNIKTALIFSAGLILGFVWGSRKSRTENLEMQKNLLQEIQKQEELIDSISSMIKRQKLQGATQVFEEVSDSVWTKEAKIKYEKAQNAKSLTDSLKFIVDVKIEAISRKRYNDSITEHLLRREIDALKSQTKD